MTSGDRRIQVIQMRTRVEPARQAPQGDNAKLVVLPRDLPFSLRKSGLSSDEVTLLQELLTGTR
jgi:hypothetical protein